MKLQFKKENVSQLRGDLVPCRWRCNEIENIVILHKLEKNGHKNAQENLCKKLQTKNLKKKRNIEREIFWERGIAANCLQKKMMFKACESSLEVT